MEGQADLTGDPELRGTYFAVRVGLVAAAVMVMLAPVAQRLFDDLHTWPRSISDSYYTSSVLIFVIGLASASVLLLVVRADQLIEHALLKVAGMFGLVVSAVACKPEDGTYPDGLATQNRFTLGALLLVGTAAWLLSRTGWFPIDTKPERHPSDVGKGMRTLVSLLVPFFLALGWFLFFLNGGHWLTTESHLWAAGGLFVVLAVVAYGRTRKGLARMRDLGDEPLRRSLSASVLADPSHRNKWFDRIYVGVAALMPLSLVYGGVCLLQDGSLLVPEYLLLLLFGVFWCTQTVQAIRELEVSGRR